MKYLKTIYILLGCMLILGACKEDDANSGSGALSITTPAYANVTYNQATLSASINGGDGVSVIKRGFCYSTEANPDIYSTTSEVKGTDISATLTGLSPKTTYHVRAFVTIYNEEPKYSEEITFTTLAESLNDELAQYEAPTYVDDYTSFSAWDKRNQWNLANVHDPTVMKADDGYYYMYQTDASYGNAHDGHGHFHGRRSKDLVNWEYLGATMNEAPAWVKTKLNEYRTEMGLSPIDNISYGFWAPVARKIANGKYRMYYSIVINNYIKSGEIPQENNVNFDGSWTERAFIGIMETADPASNIWEDKGFVVCSASDRAKDGWARASATNYDAYFKINAIDPTYIITPNGEHWLIYGSWHSGIAALQVNAETGKPATEPGKPWNITGENNSGYGKIIATRGTSRWQATEGPEIMYRDGYYYLFLAYGTLAVEYNTRVCRSASIDGPYVDMYNTSAIGGGDLYPILTAPYKFNNSYGWVGISHCGIFDDGNGNWFYTSQGRFPEKVGGNEYSNAIMMGHVRSIHWAANGWPLVMPERYGAVPQAPITEEELGGNWEHMALTNNTGSQRSSETLTFDLSTHKITSGSWANATWTFDASAQTITTSAGVVLYLQREVDWEASPRVHTIVYTAHGNKKTYWGKKTQ